MHKFKSVLKEAAAVVVITSLTVMALSQVVGWLAAGTSHRVL